ncbi:threonine synthase [Dethiobacter alkaliphilus]|uniref:threonine synthase n=1 Tax=Dethiobacter alkaliphilus TaxID=427926 RepID=UPI0022279F28|nr:threonine synthase [Dethiobacter alkaliphilus]MCW3488922.1 threonine synthase [Dethiobacter alkaliphilus]
MTQLLYHSTRGGGNPVTASEAILQGIAADGGLYVPQSVPQIDLSLDRLAELNYHQLAYEILRLYLTDYSEEELRRAIGRAYDEKFTTPEIAPLQKQAGVHFLELFHGPTLAFKDMALSILPHLLQIAVKKAGLGKEVVILTATSGDTGKAALEGFAGVDGTRIIVFFPEHGVSPVQKKQMVTQTGENTYVVGIEGNFDDAQSGVKAMFTDTKLLSAMDKNGFAFSSANSINIGRLVPQVVYYFHAYLSLVSRGEIKSGEEINFSVPTGNFGNILAGYYAKQMGLPISKLICASNKNKVLFDFFSSGTYDRKREFFVTMSPSMDILISSNLERLLYHISGQSPGVVSDLMANLADTGQYRLPENMQKSLTDFVGGYATEEETAQAIRQVLKSSDYLMDPHTAVAYSVWQKYSGEAGDQTPTVVVSTASPYKFSKDVLTAIDAKFADYDDFALFKEVDKLSAGPIPQAIKDLQTKPVQHKRVCQKDEMRAIVENILGI